MENHPWVWYLRGVTVTGIICGSVVWIAQFGIRQQFEISAKGIVLDGEIFEGRNKVEIAIWDSYYKHDGEADLKYWKWLKERELKPVPDPLSEEKESKATKKFELLPAPNFEPEEKVKPVPAPNPFLELDEGWHPTPEWKKKKDADDGNKRPKSVPIFPIRKSYFTQK